MMKDQRTNFRSVVASINLSISSNSFFGGNTGIDLGCPDIAVPEHPTDGFYRYTLFERNQAGEAMSA